MSESSQLLPPVRRLVVAHQANGEAKLLDDQVPTVEFGGFRVGSLFVQEEFEPSDPIKAIDGVNGQGGMHKDGGVMFKAVEIPPNTETPMHFTDTIDHLVVTHGSLQLVLHDGTKKEVNVGDVITQLAAVHQWNNIGSTWARFIGIVLPSKPVLVDGQTLDKGPLQALKF